MTAKKYTDLFKASPTSRAGEASTNPDQGQVDKEEVQKLLQLLQGKIKDPELAKKAAQILESWVNKNTLESKK